MIIRAEYKEKTGDNDFQEFPFEEGTTDLEIRETLKQYVGRKFGHVGIKITIDGRPFE